MKSEFDPADNVAVIEGTARGSVPLWKLKNEAQKKRLIEYFERYRADPEDQNALFSEVLDFAKNKLYHLENEFRDVGTPNTVDDYAQEVVIAVWSQLPKFRGDGNGFYQWLYAIVKNKRVDFFNELKDQKHEKVSLTVKHHGLEMNSSSRFYEEEVDNPILYENQFNDSFPTIPRSVEGIDRLICKLLLEPRQVDGNGDEKRPRRRRNTVDYAYIAGLLDMSESAVTMRVKRLRDRLKTERAQEKAAWEAKRKAAENERRDGFQDGLSAVRARKQSAGE